MNPDTNKLEPIFDDDKAEKIIEQMERIRDMRASLFSEVEKGGLVRADGSAVPAHWSTFKVDEHVVVKDYTFKVAYLNETTLVLEPVGPLLVDADS